MSCKNFVLDTNVLLHNPESIFDFDDNNVVISPIVLEELDVIKSQSRAVSRDARQAVRLLESIVEECDLELLGTTGVPRNDVGGKLIIPSLKAGLDLLKGIGTNTNDKLIIRDALMLENGMSYFEDFDLESIANRLSPDAKGERHETIFVSRDLNARLIARAHGLKAEDYKGAHLDIKESDIPTGFLSVARESLFQAYIDTVKGRFFTFDKEELERTVGEPIYPHLALTTEDEDSYIIKEVHPKEVVCEHLPTSAMRDVFGIEPKDYRQAAALHALMDENIPLTVITGEAGSGKTLLAIAASLEKLMESKDPRERSYNKIIVSRALEDLDKEIGALPGTEAEKVKPWMGGIEDNIEFLLGYDKDGSAPSSEEINMTMGYVDRYFEYKSINYMRGRNIQRSLFILDEAQNLTPSQIKTLVTRAGQGCKVVVLGDLEQIDNPYLSKYSSGLTYLIESMKESLSTAHYHLKGSPRSFLASEGNRLL